MMARLADEPFDSEEWIFEIKWDGYRAIAVCTGDRIELWSRNLISFTDKFSPVTESLRALNIEAVLDGEIVALNEKGIADFQALQNWQSAPVTLGFFVFDVIWVNGFDVRDLTLVERKQLLRAIIPGNDPVIKYSDHVECKGIDFFRLAVEQGLEGIMAKKAGSAYRDGERNSDWVKLKVSKRQEVVIAGYTEPRNTRNFFGALMLGVYEDDQLVYVGHTGSGFTQKTLEDVWNKLQKLKTDDCPFEDCPKGNTPVTWVKPKLICEIKFSEWTKDRIARHPIFMGLRSDKKPADVGFEKQITMAKSTLKDSKRSAARKAAAPGNEPTVKSRVKSSAAKRKTSTKPSSGKKKVAGEGIQIESNDMDIVVNRHTLHLTNLNKLYWKKEKFSKGNMLDYYSRIAPFMMPYMLDRPQSLNRHPNGIDGPNFYQKDQKDKLPSWMKTHEDFSESTGKHIDYLVCGNEATLLYMANLGCIEMHPWHSRTRTWEKPDWCLIDLDPDDTNTFDQVIEVAKLVKDVLDSIGADAYCKTSGSTGIHIYVPLGAKYTFDQSKDFAELVVNLVHAQMPDITSIERSPARRKGLIYLDYLQNRQTQTAAAPYSLRPRPGVPVSTPLDWAELKKGLKPTNFTAYNIFDRLKETGDLFTPVLGKGIQLNSVLSKLSSIV